MTTLNDLEERKRTLQKKLDAGDLSVERTLEQIDRAIVARTLKVHQSRERLEAVKRAVAAGMDKDQARRINKRAAATDLSEMRAKRLLNRF